MVEVGDRECRRGVARTLLTAVHGSGSRDQERRVRCANATR